MELSQGQVAFPGDVADEQASMKVDVRSLGTVELRTALDRRCHAA